MLHLVENPHAGETKPSEDITEIEVVWTGASETQKKTNLLDRHERNGGSHAGSCNHLPHNFICTASLSQSKQEPCLPAIWGWRLCFPM
ncbi:hypothetical protein C0Q70_02609 [Pomacea canaliculata]|uniref:Uncharacterized protein n=1 Tax=Pomacea canaliculata TaxID=400727 RepID=A0A2T7PQE1_POMCA|nr:hypothetical protein C0Q70_02609 [Pomacea canaliculata]